MPPFDEAGFNDSITFSLSWSLSLSEDCITTSRTSSILTSNGAAADGSPLPSRVGLDLFVSLSCSSSSASSTTQFTFEVGCGGEPERAVSPVFFSRCAGGRERLLPYQSYESPAPIEDLRCIPIHALLR